MTQSFEYALGQQVRIIGTFTDINGTLTDTTPTLYTLRPDGVEVSYTVGIGVIHDSTGVYHLDLLLNQTGLWWFAWEGTGALQAAMSDAQIYVDGSRVRSS